jgi:ABC-type polysaccharide/polyol phosphate export permease
MNLDRTKLRHAAVVVAAILLSAAFGMGANLACSLLLHTTDYFARFAGNITAVILFMTFRSIFWPTEGAGRVPRRHLTDD